MKKNYLFLMLLLILVLGFSLRLYDLDKESIWYDESYSVLDASKPNVKGVLDSVKVTEAYSPPLYYVMLHFWLNIFGSSIFSLRFLSVIFSILSIPIIYLIGDRLWSNKAGLIAAFLFSISLVQVIYSQEIRTFTFFVFLELLSFYFFIRIIQSRKGWFPYILSSILMYYSLQLSLFVFVLQNLIIFFFFFEKKSLIKKWLLSQLLIFILGLPILKDYFLTYKINVVWNILSLVHKYSFPSFLQNTFVIVIVSFIVTLFAVVLIFISRKKILDKFDSMSFSPKFFIFLFLISWIFSFFVLPSFLKPIFVTKYLFFLLPAYYLFLGFGISKFKKPIVGIILLIFILVSASLFIPYYQSTIKEDWKGVVGFVEFHEKPDDLFFFAGGKYAFDFHYGGNSPTFELFEVTPDFDISVEKSAFLDQLPSLVDDNIWFITARDWLADGFYQDTLSQSHKLALQEEFGSIKVFYFESKNT